MTALNMLITDAGFAAITDAENGLTDAVQIASIGFTATPFIMAPTLTALPGQVQLINALSGQSLAANKVHVTARDTGSGSYTVTGFGLYTSDGALFAVYSANDAILTKTAMATALIAIDVVFENDVAGNISFGDANFSYPPASETVQGVAEIADDDEVTAATDDARMMTALKTANMLNNRRPFAAAAQANDAANATHVMTPEQVQRLIRAALPAGVISMWSGAVNAVPTGWALCDGNGGRPDLRNRFVVGAGGNYAVAANGGAAEHSHGGSVGDHVLTEAQMPRHDHHVVRSGNGSASITANNSVSEISTSGGDSEYSLNSVGGTANIGLSSSTGGGQAHNHDLTIENASNLPPYYALAFIMKL